MSQLERGCCGIWGWKPELLLIVLQHTGQTPQHIMIWPEMSTAARLRATASDETQQGPYYFPLKLPLFVCNWWHSLVHFSSLPCISYSLAILFILCNQLACLWVILLIRWAEPGNPQTSRLQRTKFQVHLVYSILAAVNDLVALSSQRHQIYFLKTYGILNNFGLIGR